MARIFFILALTACCEMSYLDARSFCVQPSIASRAKMNSPGLSFLLSISKISKSSLLSISEGSITRSAAVSKSAKFVTLLSPLSLWAAVLTYPGSRLAIKAVSHSLKCPPMSRHEFAYDPNSSFHYAACVFCCWQKALGVSPPNDAWGRIML